MKPYDHKDIEQKWQKAWEDKQIYKTSDSTDKPKHYILDMFPYPSGAGLHVGHPRGYIASDVFARFKRMQGFNVLHPMGFDSFGLPAEQYAIATGNHPGPYTDELVTHYKRQLTSMGFSYDWSREVATHTPEYYKWTQWIFIQLYNSWYNTTTNKTESISTCIEKLSKEDLNWNNYSEKEKQDILMHYRIAYEGYAEVNWCPELGTVLANDEVVTATDGTMVSERGEYPVVRKSMRQWFMRISSYADRLLSGLDTINWPHGIKEIQRNWIGKSEGSEIVFKLSTGDSISVFTTRADTLFGVTYIVLAPEHEFVQQLAPSITNWSEVEAYIATAKATSEDDRINDKNEKTGVCLEGISAINPANGEVVPVWIANYVLANYGTGAVMAVPAHDERDFEFAQKYNLPIREVILPTLVDKVNPHEEGKPFVTRSVAHAIVYDPKQKKYLIIRNKKFGWDTVIIGGIEGDEDPTATALREVREETGYTDLVFKRVLGGQTKALYYTKHKGENRIAFATAVYFELQSEAQVPIGADEDSENEVLWVEARDFIPGKMVNSELSIWLARLANEYGAPYVDDGELINSAEFSSLTSEEARTKITEFVGGKIVTKYKMRDAIFARQRYWGEPIPLRHIPIVPKLDIEFSGEFRYKLLKSGEKKIEVRALDKVERKDVKKGDILKFTHIEKNEHFFVEVQSVKHFSGVKEIFNEGDIFLQDTFPGEEIQTLEQLYERYKKVAPDYEKRIDEYGAVAWYIKKIDLTLIEPLTDSELPLKLPDLADFAPAGDGGSPLSKSPEWVSGGYETNTMPGWAGSSWYFLRYMDPHNSEAFASPEAVKYWGQVDMYVGGAEHATGHLLYSRFWNMALHDLGYVPFAEPFAALRNQGLIGGPDGRKMSKRWGNVINPDDVIAQLGADTLRVYESFMGPFEAHLPWSIDGIVGPRRFIERMYRNLTSEKLGTVTTPTFLKVLHKTIKKVTDDIESFSFNTAISALMICSNEFEKADSVSTTDAKIFLQLLAPFAPHMTEELWAELGETESIHLSPWPVYDEKLLIEDSVTIAVQINSKVRAELVIASDATKESIEQAALVLPRIAELIEGKEIKKVIVIPGRIINIVL